MPVVEINSLLQERYRITRQLGAGGASTVYLAFDEMLGRPVAIKILHQWKTNVGSEIALRRFEREAQALSQLLHANIIRVFSYGIFEGENDSFLVMEHVEGESLKEYLNKKIKLPVNEAVDIALQICSGLEYASKASMIHRDLKPENIMIIANHDGSELIAKILDFGLCKIIPDEELDSKKRGSTTLTETGLLVGTAAYMSPEQGLGEQVDLRSDIYSFGCLLFEMITGTPPFTGTPGELLLKHQSESFPRIADLCKHVPAELQDLILKCTAKNKIARYANYHDLGQDLLKIAEINCNAIFSLTGRSSKTRKVPLLLLAGVLGIIVPLIIAFIIGQQRTGLQDANEALEQHNARRLERILAAQLSKSDYFHASEIAAALVRSKALDQWDSDKKVDFLDSIFKLFVESKQYKDALLIANRLFIELVDQGIGLFNEQRKDSVWEERFCRVSKYLLDYVHSPDDWHQIFYKVEVSNGEKNRSIQRILSDNGRLVFNELRANAALKQLKHPGSAESQKAVDLFISAAKEAWSLKRYKKYSDFMKKADELGVNGLSAAVDYHALRAKEYELSGDIEKSSIEKKLSENFAITKQQDKNSVPGLTVDQQLHDSIVNTVAGKQIESSGLKQTNGVSAKR